MVKLTYTFDRWLGNHWKVSTDTITLRSHGHAIEFLYNRNIYYRPFQIELTNREDKRMSCYKLLNNG